MIAIMVSFFAGAACMLGVVMANDKKRHAEHVRDWKIKNTGYAIIRSRHRRSARHRGEVPLPLDLIGYQVEKYGKARVKRIGGVWG